MKSGSVDSDRPRVCNVALANQGLGRMVDRVRTLRDVHGWDVTCLIGGPDGALQSHLRAAHVPYRVLDLDLRMLPSPWQLVPAVVDLAALFRRERFDVVQTSLFPSMLVGRLAAWLADVPVRVAFVMGPFHLDAPITRWMDIATWWMDSRLVATCQSIQDAYSSSGVPDGRLALIRTGVDETRFDPDTVSPYDLRAEYGWPADTPVVGHVAWFYMRLGASRWIPPTCRGRAAKGHDDLIRATPDILREFPNARVVLIGGGWLDAGTRYMREMMDLVKELGLQEHVIFAGARSNVASIYQAVDVAVHPSVTEACGGTLESLLMARPTVATRVGGMPDLVIDGQTGLLVNPADPADLARGVCALLRDRERGHALARAGRAHALRTVTLSKAAADLDALYRDALFQNGRRRAGYRWWVSLARLPVVIAVTFYLNGRYMLEGIYLSKWAAGWRPWQPRALAVLPFELLALPFVVLAPRSWMLGLHNTYVRMRYRLRHACSRVRRRIGLRRTYDWLRRQMRLGG
jgi:glycosyltransferase involved in cell wall biosynthesis